MKKSILFLAIIALFLAACGGSAQSDQEEAAAAKATRQAAKQTQIAEATANPQSTNKLARVSAMCTLQGKPVDTIVAPETQVVIYWEWIAATQEQAQAGIDQGQTSVTLDGQPLATIHVRPITQAANGKFNVTWWSNVGALAAGTHTITYSASWKAQITDGTSTFGPSGTYETQSDTCTITVQ